MGPSGVARLGLIPDIKFDRLFVILLLVALPRVGTTASRRTGWLSNRMDYGLVFFLAACLCSIPGSLMLRGPLRVLLDALLIPCVYYFVAKRCMERVDFLPKLYIAGWLALLALGFMGCCEGLSGHDFLKYELETTHAEGTEDFRVNGPFSTAEQYGIVLDMLILFVATYHPMRRNGLVRRSYLITGLVVSLVAVAYTVTRGVWLSLVAGWLAFNAVRRPMFTLGVSAFTVVVALLLTQGVLPQVFGNLWQRRIANEKTIYSRVATYKSALAMFENHPVLGVGFSAFSESVERFPEEYSVTYKGSASVETPHNVFFGILAETGIVGLVAFLVFQWQVFSQCGRLVQFRSDRVYSPYAVTCGAIAVAFIVGGLGNYFVYNSGFVNKLYFMFLGIMSGMLSMIQTADRQEQPVVV
jgi:hypothetical protein